MPLTLTGTASAVSARPSAGTVTVTAPAGADFPSSSSQNQPDQGLLDKIASIFAHAGFLDVASAWTTLQTFGAGIAGTVLNFTTATLSGALNAASASISGALTAASATITTLGATTANVSGTMTANAMHSTSAAVSAALTAGTIGAGSTTLTVGSGTVLTCNGTVQLNNNIQVAAQIHQTGGAGSGGIVTENRVQGLAVNAQRAGGNQSYPANLQDGDMWTNTNRLYIRLGGNAYLINDPGSPLAFNGTNFPAGVQGTL